MLNRNATRFLLCVTAYLCHSYAVAQTHRITVWYDDDKLIPKEIYTVTDTISKVLHGPFKSYFQNGKLQSTGYYNKNKPDSVWTYFYENGELKMEGSMRNGIHSGCWKYYFENGNLSMEGCLKDSKQVGHWIYYYENGIKKKEGEFKNGEQAGIWNYFYEDGLHKAQAFYQNNKGKYKEFYPDGSLKAEGINVNGKSDSIWVYYYNNGHMKATGQLEEGMKEGVWSFYHDNGELSGRGRFKKGVKEGKWEYYHANGQISSEGALIEGKKEGYWKMFNQNGSFKAESVFDEGEGPYTEYYESGKIKVKGYIKDGKNEGKWEYFYETGELEGECNFAAGYGQYTGYYQDGTVKMKGHIQDGKNAGLWDLYKPDGQLAGYYRPYYEDDTPIYKMVEKPQEPRVPGEKPAYKYKKRSIRYFEPVLNELRGYIISVDPVATLYGKLPVSFETYKHERLGYEFSAALIKKPFYISEANLGLNKIISRGFEVSAEQKYYHPEHEYGMIYFGHGLSMANINHSSNILDSVSLPHKQFKIDATEYNFEYSVIVGNRWLKVYGERWMKNASKKGISIDLYIGLGVGYRIFDKHYPLQPVYENIFSRLNQSAFLIKPKAGITVGYFF